MHDSWEEKDFYGSGVVADVAGGTALALGGLGAGALATGSVAYDVGEWGVGKAGEGLGAAWDWATDW